MASDKSPPDKPGVFFGVSNDVGLKVLTLLASILLAGGGGAAANHFLEYSERANTAQTNIDSTQFVTSQRYDADQKASNDKFNALADAVTSTSEDVKQLTKNIDRIEQRQYDAKSR